MAAEHRTTTSTGLEIGPPLPEEEVAYMQALHRKYTANRLFLQSQRTELLKDHDGEFFAASDGQIFHSPDVDELFAQLEASNVDRAAVVVRFLTSEPRQLCFHA